jgi:restriction endonuclease Mrr
MSKKPDVFETERFVKEPTYHLTPDATQEEKDEFETYMNTGNRLLDLMDEHTDMVDPYYTWEGKVIDKGEFGFAEDLADMASFLF